MCICVHMRACGVCLVRNGGEPTTRSWSRRPLYCLRDAGASASRTELLIFLCLRFQWVPNNDRAAAPSDDRSPFCDAWGHMRSRSRCPLPARCGSERLIDILAFEIQLRF